MTTKYRADIDGLRAVSVWRSCASTSTFGGGYIGIGAFFVISGYRRHLQCGHTRQMLCGGSSALASKLLAPPIMAFHRETISTRAQSAG
jgi:hypothetical protein